MSELLCHLIGDYVLQTDRMASKKRSSWFWAIVHAAAYTLPFAVLTRDPRRLVIIFGTHAVIDHYGLARFVVRAKNCATEAPSNWYLFDTATGYPEGTPPFFAFWLLIIADNTMHLAINRAALGAR